MSKPVETLEKNSNEVAALAKAAMKTLSEALKPFETEAEAA